MESQNKEIKYTSDLILFHINFKSEYQSLNPSYFFSKIENGFVVLRQGIELAGPTMASSQIQFYEYFQPAYKIFNDSQIV